MDVAWMFKKKTIMNVIKEDNKNLFSDKTTIRYWICNDKSSIIFDKFDFLVWIGEKASWLKFKRKQNSGKERQMSKHWEIFITNLSFV